MVGFFIVGVALLALLFLVAYTYTRRGPETEGRELPPGAREGESW